MAIIHNYTKKAFFYNNQYTIDCSIRGIRANVYLNEDECETDNTYDESKVLNKLISFYDAVKDVWKLKEDEHRDNYTGTIYVSYDNSGNVTWVDFNDYVGDGNSYITLNVSFAEAKDIILNQNNYQV